MTSDCTPTFDQNVARFVSALVGHRQIGLYERHLRIADLYSGRQNCLGNVIVDRFKLLIPYAGQLLIWEILFDSNYADNPPDVILGEESNFCPNINDVTALVHWEANDPRSLLLLVAELLDLYTCHQLDQFDGDARFELNSLYEIGYTAKDIEALTTVNRQGKSELLSMFIGLRVDFAKLPKYFYKDSPGESYAVLKFSFNNSGIRKTCVQLELSCHVNSCFGPRIRLPNYLPGVALSDYIQTISQLLNEKVDEVVQTYGKRRDYTTAFLNFSGQGVLEFDTDSFYNMAFLMEWHDFFFIVRVELSSNFPRDSPHIMLVSVYHESHGKPYSKLLKNVPYSPRWTSQEVVDRTRTFLLDSIASFQRESVSDGDFS